MTVSDQETESATSASEFPADLPQGCPPDDASYAWGTVYRIVKSNPLSADDFRTWFEEGKAPRPGKECDSHGLSVFREVDHAVSYSERYPYLGELIAQASLSEQHGKIAPTPRVFEGVTYTHETWWPYQNLERHVLFEVVSEEE